MSPVEWAMQIAQIKAYWPAAESWNPRTISAYYELLEHVAANEVAKVVKELAAEGLSSPPTAGKILKRAKANNPALVQMGAAVACTCPTDFRTCKSAHSPGWFERREMEAAADAIVEQCERMGVEIDPSAYPGVPTMEIAIAVAKRNGWKREQEFAAKPMGKIESGYLDNLAAGMLPADALSVSVNENVPKDAFARGVVDGMTKQAKSRR